MNFPISSSYTKYALVFGLMFSLLMSSTSPAVAQINSQTDLEGVAVAIYGDEGADASRDGWLALGVMYEWMNASVTYVNATEIRNGILTDFDIFVMPGGPPGVYSVYLQEAGKQEIRDFVHAGGSYVGICGGSEFALTQYLRLRVSSIRWSVVGPGISTINMTLNTNSTGPDFSDLPETFTTMYWNSGYFQNITEEVIPIATYPQNNQPGMIAFPCGEGNVFLSSPHPEFEEESDRDGTTDFDYLDDPDSEWPMMLRISRWLVDSSNVTEDADTVTIPDSFNAIGGSVVLIVAVVIYIRRR